MPDITKLPKWAQEHIRNLERERQEAIRALNEWQDDQLGSPFYVDEFLSLGEERGPSIKRRYVHAHKMTVEWRGVTVHIYLREGIDIKWGSADGMMGDVAMIPRSYQQVYLVAKENMR